MQTIVCRSQVITNLSYCRPPYQIPSQAAESFTQAQRQPAFLRDRSRLCGHRIGSYKGRRAIAADQSDQFTGLQTE